MLPVDTSTHESPVLLAEGNKFPNYSARDQVPAEYKWDLSKLYTSVDAWNEALTQLKQDLSMLDRFRDCELTAQSLGEMLTVVENLSQTEARLGMYSFLFLDCDTKDPVANNLASRMSSFGSEFQERISFVEPKILEQSWEQVDEMLSSNSALEVYRYKLSDLFRKKSAYCKAEIESVIGAATSVLFGPERTYGTLLDTDLKVPNITYAGESLVVSLGNYESSLSHASPEARATIFKEVFSTFGQFADTFTSLYSSHLEGELFKTKQRGFEKIADYYLFLSNIPLAVSDATTLGCQQFTPAWNKHFDLRRQVLGLETLKFSDVFAPLSLGSAKIPYQHAVEMVLQSLAPLGEEYVNDLRHGLINENWVDVYATPNKRSNAYSYCGYNTPPVIMLNYTGTITEVSTLAHEAGHSMHTLNSSATQPYAYHRFALFNTEIASTVNQILFSRHFLNCATDRDQKLDVISSALYPLHRYLLQMPVLSEVEKFAHAAIETGAGLSSETMNSETVKMLEKYYGGAIDISGTDRELLGSLWIGFGHFYMPTYVRMYSSGILAACQIAQEILEGDGATLERYHKFLKAGGSKPPLEILSDLGVDFNTSRPFDAANKILNFFNSQLEELISL